MEGKPDWLPGFPVQIYCNRGDTRCFSYLFTRVKNCYCERKGAKVMKKSISLFLVLSILLTILGTMSYASAYEALPEDPDFTSSFENFDLGNEPYTPGDVFTITDSSDNQTRAVFNSLVSITASKVQNVLISDASGKYFTYDSFTYPYFELSGILYHTNDAGYDSSDINIPVGYCHYNGNSASYITDFTYYFTANQSFSTGTLNVMHHIQRNTEYYIYIRNQTSVPGYTYGTLGLWETDTWKELPDLG